MEVLVMRTALCCTTIHIPHALKLMRKCSADVRFFVAMDEKTPDEAFELVNSLEHDDQNAAALYKEGHPWKCSEAIGWNCIQRRNIAFLEALAWGADILYSWDTDNYATDISHFAHIEDLFSGGFDGIKVSGPAGWFDPGQLLIPQTRQRGFPYDQPVSKFAHPCTNAKVGVAAGIVIGNPDCDAVTRMEHKPDIGAVHVLGSVGVVVDVHTWTIFNSQNSAVIRELVPAWFLMPGVGRMDDIFASLVVQRVARERGYHVHLGKPFVFQQRHDHNLVTDLRAEIDGYENVKKLADLLDHIVLPGKSVIDDVMTIYQVFIHGDTVIPAKSAVAGLLWLEDCEGILG